MTESSSSATYIDEVSAALEVDDTVIGAVFRGTRLGKSEAILAEEIGTKYKNFVWNYRRSIRAIVDGELPSAPSVARMVGGALRGFSNRHAASLSIPVKTELELRAAECVKRSENLELLEREDEVLDEKGRAAEKSGIVGIYVYTLPHYHNHPIQPSDIDPRHDRTLMKVGKSDSDVIRRFQAQARNTSLPEDPRLLRIYTGIEGKGDVEGRFHRLLSAADHRRNRGRVAGTEWFLTSLVFLDALAADMELETYFSLDESPQQES